MSDRQIRASDADREQVAQALRDHYAAGRISDEELSERLDGAVRASTMQELDRLRGDLPELPASPSARRAELQARRSELRGHLMQQAGGAFTPFAICTLIWAASGANDSFWPVWLLIFPLVFIVGNVWRLYGPAPDLDRVQAELEHRGQRRGRHRPRGPRRRELP